MTKPEKKKKIDDVLPREDIVWICVAADVDIYIDKNILVNTCIKLTVDYHLTNTKDQSLYFLKLFRLNFLFLEYKD